MGSVHRGARIALVGSMVASLATACGISAPTSDFKTKQVVPLASYPLAAPVNAYGGALAAAMSTVQPLSTNIVGTSPWLGFPTPATAAGLLPWPVFAPNVGQAMVLNGQAGYLLGSGPVLANSSFPWGGGVLGVGWGGGLLGFPGAAAGLLSGGVGVAPVMGMPWLTGAALGPLAAGAIGAAGFGVPGPAVGGGLAAGAPLSGGMQMPQMGQMPMAQQNGQQPMPQQNGPQQDDQAQ